MKDVRLLFAFIMHVFCMSAQAQSSQLEYHSFAEDGKEWQTQVGGILENLYCNRIDGDTVINGESWKKVYNYVAFPFNYTYYAAIRDEGKKVYAIAKGSTRPRLLYDFGLKKGDLVRCGVEGNVFGCLLDNGEQPDSLLGFPFVSYLGVERIDTIEAQGMRHRRFTLTLLDAYQRYYQPNGERISGNIIWVEGIGSGAGPFSPWKPLPQFDLIYQFCYIGKTCLFGYPDFYDADISDSVGSTHYEESEDHNSYDLSGRRVSVSSASSVSSVLPRGVYIKDGKKVVVR